MNKFRTLGGAVMSCSAGADHHHVVMLCRNPAECPQTVAGFAKKQYFLKEKTIQTTTERKSRIQPHHRADCGVSRVGCPPVDTSMETRSTPQDGLPVPCGTPVPKEVPSFAGDQWSLAIESVTDWPNGNKRTGGRLSRNCQFAVLGTERDGLPDRNQTYLRG